MVGAFFFFMGQQSRNQFRIGMREIESQLLDIMNDVATGYYSSPGSFVCEAPPSAAVVPPTFPALGTPHDLGENAQCTFTGKIIHLSPNGNDELMNQYVLIGRRQVGNPGRDVRTLQDASPALLEIGGSEYEQPINLPYGISIASADADGSPIGSFAIASRYAGNAGLGGISGTQDVDLISIGVGYGANASVVSSAVNGNLHTFPRSPNSGIVLCFNSGTTNQHAVLIIGGAGKQITTFMQIEPGAC